MSTAKETGAPAEPREVKRELVYGLSNFRRIKLLSQVATSESGAMIRVHSERAYTLDFASGKGDVRANQGSSRLGMRVKKHSRFFPPLARVAKIKGFGDAPALRDIRGGILDIVEALPMKPLVAPSEPGLISILPEIVVRHIKFSLATELPEPPPRTHRVLLKDALSPRTLQVETIERDAFTAILNHVGQRSRRLRFPINLVAPGDRSLLREGAVFYWATGVLTDETGQPRHVTQIQFQRLVAPPDSERNRAAVEARELIVGRSWSLLTESELDSRTGSSDVTDH